MPKRMVFLERYVVLFCAHDSVLGNLKEPFPYFLLSRSMLTNLVGLMEVMELASLYL